MKNSILITIDPGTLKCGLAVMLGEKVLESHILKNNEFEDAVLAFDAKYRPAIILIGSGTNKLAIEKKVTALKLSAPIFFVPEKNTTLEARQLYWKYHPPKGLWRFIPTSLRVPPVPVDDLAAIVIALRFLEKTEELES